MAKQMITISDVPFILADICAKVEFWEKAMIPMWFPCGHQKKFQHTETESQ